MMETLIRRYAYGYAARQALGMSFEPFRYTVNGLVFIWTNSITAQICKLLAAIGLTWIAERLFNSAVIVQPAAYIAEVTMYREIVRVDNGALIVGFDYDDIDLNILRVMVNNSSAGNYYIKATATATGREYRFTIPPGVIEQDVPQTIANRLHLTVTASGKLDGVEWEVY